MSDLLLTQIVYSCMVFNLTIPSFSAIVMEVRQIWPFSFLGYCRSIFLLHDKFYSIGKSHSIHLPTFIILAQDDHDRCMVNAYNCVFSVLLAELNCIMSKIAFCSIVA